MRILNCRAIYRTTALALALSVVVGAALSMGGCAGSSRAGLAGTLAAPPSPLAAPPTPDALTPPAGADTTLPVALPAAQVIGYSALGHPLEMYRLGDGGTRIVFIGGTVLLAYAVIDYLAAHPDAIPANVTVEIIPAANPDGAVKVVGHPGRFTVEEVAADTRPGRLNGNGIDLNRNWDCRWAPVGLWGKREVSGGSAPHSEPETQALIEFLGGAQAVIFWHSAAPGVFAGGCEGDFAPGVALAQAYAGAAGYPYQAAFTSYAVTGDAVDWLAAQGLPAIEVELRTHDEIEWEQNIAGVLAVLAHLGASEP
jgi:hypothetical protein